MKAHTSSFKEQIKELGRELKGIITYGNITLEDEINSITPHYEADILKSVMKQLDLELTVDIPLNTVINCKIGILVDNQYEMLNFGNYVVYKTEKQEDTSTYKITCYDKMLYSMKQNENLGVTYPITIKNYLNAVASKIGLSVANTTFYNQDMQIEAELYLGLEYTYRDILDEIAQATGSIICLNENDEILVKYPTKTNDTIDENYLKDVNVDFGQKYGVINSIVLSRSGESDNVYLRDEDSVVQNGLTEVKIIDNQIMNFNNRSDYLQGILNALNGLYYFLNDFNSTGILYYDVGDLYNIQIKQNVYQCLMLNDEINITTGIEEIIHTDMPERSETDYTKADKTDRRINQTYLIVDKQNQKIESVVSNVTEQNNKISQITQTVDRISSEVEEISNMVVYAESNSASVQLNNINESEPVVIKVRPINSSISYLYPRDTLFPSDTLFMPDRIIRFKRSYQNTTENIDYVLPDDLLIYNSEVYDEFYLDYENQICQVIKRCKYNSDGSISPLETAMVNYYSYPFIALGDGDYEVSIPNHDFGYLYVGLMAKNIYTEQFYTKSATSSRIEQKTDQITAEVNRTLTNYSTTNEMNSAIQLKADQITSSVTNTYETKRNAISNFNILETRSSQIDQKADSISSTVSYVQSEVDANRNNINTNTFNISTLTQTATSLQSQINSNGNNISTLQQTATSLQSQINSNDDDISTLTQTATSLQSQITNNDGDISTLQQTTQGLSSTVSGKVGYNEVVSSINQSSEAVSINANKISLNGKTINLSGDNIAITSNRFSVNNNGDLTCSNATITGGKINITGDGTASDLIRVVNSSNNSEKSYIQPVGAGFIGANGRIDIMAEGTTSDHCVIDLTGTSGYTSIKDNGIRTPKVTQTSLESIKKNIKKYNKNVLEIIKDSEIYTYNFKTEKDTDKKHIGFIIGDLGGNYNTPNEIISQDEDGIDTYNMTSMLWKAVQEYIEKTDIIIEQMKREIKELKGENK